MLRIARRFLVAGYLASAVLTCALTAPAQAQTGWEYVPELGGYLDWDTGLVWGEHSLNVVGGGGEWDYFNGTYLRNYRALTGIAAWRMPTVAESQLAAAHGINAAIDNPIPWSACWTSESQSKGIAKQAHYAVDFNSGGVALFNNKSRISFVPVYRAFTP